MLINTRAVVNYSHHFLSLLYPKTYSQEKYLPLIASNLHILVSRHGLAYVSLTLQE